RGAAMQEAEGRLMTPGLLRRSAPRNDDRRFDPIAECSSAPSPEHGRPLNRNRRPAPSDHPLPERESTRHSAGGVRSRASCFAEDWNFSPGRAWNKVEWRSACSPTAAEETV